MLIIGLTGGIASGKTTVANFFKEKNIAVIDMDAIAHALVTPEKKAYKSILQHFGDEILLADKTLNRRLLREKIFSDTQEKEWLETLLHPLIREQVRNEVKKTKSAYYIIVIPLLIENYPYPEIDRVLVVDSSEKNQIHRAMQRDNISETLAKEIIAQQAGRNQRLKYADDIILNDYDLNKIKTEVESLHQRYLKLSST